MLILTRRVGETVVIGNDVTVTVLGVKGNQVRLGVNAPREVAVHREEIYERIKREQAEDDARPQQAVSAVRGRTAPVLAEAEEGLTRAAVTLAEAVLGTELPRENTAGAASGPYCFARRNAGVQPLEWLRASIGEVAEWSKALPC